MKIQSLSIVVPNRKCINDCKFCVSKMHANGHKNMMDDNKPFYDLYLKDYLKRLEFARDNGCNTVMLTGNSEPQQNRTFLTYFGLFMMLMKQPFRNVEMQTTGVLLDPPYLRFLRNHVGVNTISVSLSSFNDSKNAEYNGTKKGYEVNLQQLCADIKRYDFNLRLSINLTDYFNSYSPESIFKEAKNRFMADQITFRVLYENGDNTPQSKWVKEHRCNDSLVAGLKEYIETNGKKLERLEYGYWKYSVYGMSTVLDNDCMSQEAKEELKYLILQPDCKLYSKWNDPASLFF